ncbi:MAG: DUF4372 domain-containing protein [Dysgonamonadaceae bacterium]|nr:DUF4372 domain-containing protein [Dysgonamonadaceae bacterium]
MLFFVNGVNISKIAKQHDAEHYVKKFDTRKHPVVMLFGIFEGYHSILSTITCNYSYRKRFFIFQIVRI